MVYNLSVKIQLRTAQGYGWSRIVKTLWRNSGYVGNGARRGYYKLLMGSDIQPIKYAVFTHCKPFKYTYSHNCVVFDHCC